MKRSFTALYKWHFTLVFIGEEYIEGKENGVSTYETVRRLKTLFSDMTSEIKKNVKNKKRHGFEPNTFELELKRDNHYATESVN